MKKPPELVAEAIALLRAEVEREGHPAIARALTAATGKRTSASTVRAWLTDADSEHHRSLLPKRARAVLAALKAPAASTSTKECAVLDDEDDDATTISIVDELRKSYRVAKREQRRVSSDPKSTHRDRAAAATGARAALRDLQKFEKITEAAIIRSEVWLRMADRILDALEPFPEAREAVIDAVTEHERDEQLGRAKRS